MVVSLRPDVVWFGESLLREELEAAVNAARTCQAFFSIGTSGLFDGPGVGSRGA